MNNKKCPDNTVEYIVKSGDTLFKIAVRNNTTIDVLLELNPELTSNLLIPGISMCVPVCENKPVKPVVPQPEPVPPVVGPTPPSEGQTGPVVEPTPPPMNRPDVVCPIAPPIYMDEEELRCGKGMCYYVKAGDTLYNIANRYNISLYELLNANRNINPYNMQIGDLVCIPIPEKR